jgi:TolB-like protein/Tfp pilus assembly protein PilF
MSSIIEGYNYDIFISYRQKDNKGDRWVSEFVDAMKTELESTFKEEISVYFDINPHDGILETHDVDASLKVKLKCLVFIPIISQTYCDSKSFAWKHEFVAFNKMAKEDQFGRDIRLAGGNVASRILPIKINDLDPEDKTLLENEIGGVLRSIEFIYKSAGVNRPLRANEDHPQDNLNKTYYRDQINKVANAVKEIITALRKLDQHEGEIRKDIVITRPETHKNPITKIIIALSVVLILILLGNFLIPKRIRPKEQLEKSIAVLPFKLLSNEPDKQYLADGMMDEITLHLSRIKELRVLGRTSTEQYLNQTKTTTEIGQELGVSYLLEGSFQKYGDSVRLIVQLIKTGKEGHKWANNYDRLWKNVFTVQSEVAQEIAHELDAAITPEEKTLIEKKPTTNLTAYDFYQQAGEELDKCWGNYYKQDLLRAEELYRESLKYDSTFAKAYVGLAWVYLNKHSQEFYSSENSSLDTMLYLANKALSFDSQLSDAYRARGRYYLLKGLYKKAIDEFDKALKYNPNDYGAYYWKGVTYESYSGDCIQVIDNISKAADRNKGKDLPFYLDVLGDYYIDGGFPDKAKYYYQEEYKLTRDSAGYLYDCAWVKERTSDFEEALKLAKRANRMDSTKIIILQFYYFLPSSYNDEAYLNAKRWAGLYEKAGDLNLISISYHIGLAFWRVGKHKEAEYYFNQQIKYCEAALKHEGYYPNYGGAYYDLAATYAFLGDKVKAYKYLDEFDKMKTNMAFWVWTIKHDPLFDSIRGEEHFKRIEQGVESRCQAEHERVRKWLEGNNIL